MTPDITEISLRARVTQEMSLRSRHRKAFPAERNIAHNGTGHSSPPACAWEDWIPTKRAMVTAR